MKLGLANCDLFDGDRTHRDVTVIVEDDRILEIVACGQALQPVDESVDLAGLLLAPGLIDLQVNGGGGVLFNESPNVDALQVIARAHRCFGTTAFLATLISDEADVIQKGIEAVAEAMRRQLPGIVGIHIEGPHLNPEYRGVHDARRMRALDDEALALLTGLPQGRTLVTLAPEMVDPSMIRRLRDAGVIVFAGHTAASYDDIQVALDAGLNGFTHLYNAMTPLKSREPGVVGAALEDAKTYIGIIADGHHVHPASLAVAIRAKAQGKTLLVSDAMPTVGAADKHFDLQGREIRAESGCCVTADGTLAGSDIGLIDAVRFVSDTGIVSRDEALRMASAYPAAALGLSDSLGFVRPGYQANLIALDAEFNVVHSWVSGKTDGGC